MTNVLSGFNRHYLSTVLDYSLGLNLIFFISALGVSYFGLNPDVMGVFMLIAFCGIPGTMYGHGYYLSDNNIPYPMGANGFERFWTGFAILVVNIAFHLITQMSPKYRLFFLAFRGGLGIGQTLTLISGNMFMGKSTSTFYLIPFHHMIFTAVGSILTMLIMEIITPFTGKEILFGFISLLGVSLASFFTTKAVMYMYDSRLHCEKKNYVELYDNNRLLGNEILTPELKNYEHNHRNVYLGSYAFALLLSFVMCELVNIKIFGDDFVFSNIS